MAHIHIILQGKGGVGKSMIASVLAQFLSQSGNAPLCIDTDPVNATFYGYKALNVERIDVMHGDEINPRAFDALIEKIAATECAEVVIDNGASSFVPLAHYLISNQVPALLEQMGHQITIHTVVTGGQALPDTLNGFVQLVRQMPETCSFCVWLNPYWGPVEYEGKHFEAMKAYKDNQSRISAMIRLPALKEETFGHDLAELLKSRQTFDDALKNADLTIMTRQRLKIVRDGIYSQLNLSVVAHG